MWKSSRNGWTLVEILVVIVIIGILTSLIVFAVAPAMKKSAAKSDLTQRLSQTAKGIVLYMNDHDDLPPITLQRLATYNSWPKETIRSPFSGMTFLYPRAFSQINQEGKAHLAEGFVEARDSIVKDMFCFDYPCGIGGNRCTTKTFFDGTRTWTYQIPGDSKTGRDPNETYRVLGARLDGSVGWVPATEEWEKPIVRK